MIRHASVRSLQLWISSDGTLRHADAESQCTDGDAAADLRDPVVISYVATENGMQPVNVLVSEVSGKYMNSSLRLRGLEDRVCCILDQFVPRTVRVSARQNFVLGLEMLGRVSRLRFVGLKALLPLVVNELGELLQFGFVVSNIHARLKKSNGNIRVTCSRTPSPRTTD